MTQNEMKSLLAEAWKEVFGVEEVSDDTDFFEAGGDSIMAVQLSAWLIQKGVKLDLADIFTASTFGLIAEKLVETDPVYIPEEMLTKEIAAKEMGFSSVEEAEEVERKRMAFMNGANINNQQACAPVDNQQACTPVGNQQACTPAGNQQACNPVGGQQICNPMLGQQTCSPVGNQQVCTPMGWQQTCIPMGNQQVCTPVGYQQVCTPVGNQQVCSPMGWQQACSPVGYQQVCNPVGNQQACTPVGNQQACTQVGDQQTCTPAGDQQVCNPTDGQQVCTPAEDQQACTPVGDQQACTPVGDQQSCTPAGDQQVCTTTDDQQVCTPAQETKKDSGISPFTPPQIKKYLSHPIDEAVENPNVILINKAKIGNKTKTPEEALMVVLKGILPNFDKENDLFAQGLTSFDTVKMVTRLGEEGYKLDLKDIYMYSTFDELVGRLK